MDYTFHLDIGRCTGCGACAVACMDQNDIEVGSAIKAMYPVLPFLVPRFRPRGQIPDCGSCGVRIDRGLEAACVRVCPTKALRQRQREINAS